MGILRKTKADPDKLSIEVQVSDLHVGSRLGLLPPGATDDQGGHINMNVYQKWLFKCWEGAWDWFEERKAEAENEHGKTIYTHLSILGEPCDIDAKSRSNQFWSKNPATVSRAAIKLLDPIVDMFDGVHFIRGTEAHGGKSNSMDEIVASNYDQAIRCDSTGMASHWSTDISLGGVVFNLGHHGKKGRLPWTAPNGLNSLATQIFFIRQQNGDIIPDVVSRGHYHQFLDTSERRKPYCVICPGWQTRTSFVHRIDPADGRPECGILFFVCNEESFEMTPYRVQYERKKPWKPTQ